MMITYDHLRWIKSTHDGRRRLKMLFWRKPALTPTNNYENKTVCVFFQGASDGNAKIRRNISQKSKNTEKLDFQKINFLNTFFSSGSMPRCIFSMFPPPEHPEDTPKTRFIPIFLKLWFLCFIEIYIEKGPRVFTNLSLQPQDAD